MLDEVILMDSPEKNDVNEPIRPTIKILSERLSVLQQKIKEAKIPVIILFEGWGASGKGSLIGKMILNLNPRGFQVFSINKPTEEDSRRPFLNRFWIKIPRRGDIAVFDRSWYFEYKDEMKENINIFERQLTDDGYLIIKFFFHITPDEQKARLNELCARKSTAWRVNELDLKQNKKYKKFYKKFDTMLENTNNENSPWHVVSGMNKDIALYNSLRILVENIEKKLADHDKIQKNNVEKFSKNEGLQNPESVETAERAERCERAESVESVETAERAERCERAESVESVETAESAESAKNVRNAEDVEYNNKQLGIAPDKMNFPLIKMPRLEDVDLSVSLGKDEYKNRLEYLQGRLRILSYELYRKNIPMILCYEGWDASGKGGNIIRTAASLDPRDYDVAPVAAPDLYEAEHHYMWRFRRSIPKTGHIQIFDRTWYGRVMVERVEGFALKEEWERAYNEINEFEKELTDWGAIIVKFWLQIDKEEQLKRFNERQNNPEKQWKITPEDWRNREKWEQYEVAVNDMLKYTSTEFAPWTIVESDCKYYSRVKTLETIIDAIEKRL